MSVVLWLQTWWGVPLLLALTCAVLALLNAAVIRDRYIVEVPSVVHARWLIAGGHVVRCAAFLSPVVPLEWDTDEVRVVLLGGLIVSYVLHLLGESTIVSRRILDRWHRGPWPGDERRRQERRAVDRRTGERRSPFAATKPVAFTDSGRVPYGHD